MGLLSNEDIETLNSFHSRKGGYFYKMLNYLEEFIENGVNENKFTLEEAKEDLDIALWYSYACNNIGDYEHYYMSKEFMKYSEKNAKGCGTWYYRYTVALIYCGKLDEALKYSEKGVSEDPNYPWGWLELAKLRLHFGNKEGAIEANNKGLELVPGDYEFLRQAEEIENYYSIEALKYHYIDEDNDKNLLKGLDYGEDKLKSIAYILCDKEKLNAIKNIINPIEWEADNPYCSFKFYIDDNYLIDGLFAMNEAAISKLDKELIKNSLEELRNIKHIIKDEENSVLTFVRFNIDYSIEASLENKETGKITTIRKKFNSDSEYKKVADEIFDSYGMPLEPYLGELPNMVTLYKREDDCFYYAECWINDNAIIKHTGIVGNKGKVDEYEYDNARDYKNFLDNFYKEYSDYREIPQEEYFYLILQFEIEPFEGNLPDKYHDAVNNIGNTLDSVLAWNVVGNISSWNAGEAENIKGKYVINFFSVVVDVDIAFRLILNEVIDDIKEDIDCSHIKIASASYEDNGEGYNLLYSSDSSQDFSI